MQEACLLTCLLACMRSWWLFHSYSIVRFLADHSVPGHLWGHHRMVFEARLAGQHCLFLITSSMPKALIQAKTIARILVNGRIQAGHILQFATSICVHTLRMDMYYMIDYIYIYTHIYKTNEAFTSASRPLCF